MSRPRRPESPGDWNYRPNARLGLSCAVGWALSFPWNTILNDAPSPLLDTLDLVVAEKSCEDRYEELEEMHRDVVAYLTS